jgi:hypothetical protein
MSYAVNASFVLESRWEKSACIGPPDFIYNMTDITHSWWYGLYQGWDNQVVPGPSFIYYTHPGLCYASRS